MSLNRYAAKSDKSQCEIIQALVDTGHKVWVIRWPVDLLVWHPVKGFFCLECKTLYGKRAPKVRVRNDQQDQNEFLEATGTLVVWDKASALMAAGTQPERSWRV